ncbi:MAG TPA: biotin carboxylase N-terminal domain-containing protein [Vicinamibacterales bacterium]|jgi:acetyl-CoA carboxylase biotin carboxylase subunit
MIRRLLIANRGEIALRVIRACQELGVESVAVYSDIDAGAPHVKAADRAVAIGRAPARESYLCIQHIVDAAKTAGADAVHPGYGFLSENSQFADACVKAGLVFVGPPADVIARMGSKIEARRIAVSAGVPVVPGEVPDDQSDAGIKAAVDRVGLPTLIKASAGGGGKGMRTVRSPEAVIESIQAARREAVAAFGDGTLYVERLIDRPHHVEVQVFADGHGHTIHLFERECSVQRRHQKVVEESPSPVLNAELRARMTSAAVAVARASGYQNAGTVEFLVDVTHGPNAPFYFLEMNTRLQVEHPVTELVTGLDLVRAQLLVASGEPLPWSEAALAQRGHAIEVRVYAEDPAQTFIPQAGTLVEYREPRRPGVRVDSGVTEGSTISVHYDPMIAKIIAHAESRPLAINRLAAALRATTIRGVRTNLPFLLSILELDAFRRGDVDTGFLDREGAALAASVADVVIEGDRSTAGTAIDGSRQSFDPWNGVAAKAAVTTTSETAQRRRTASTGPQTITAPMPATVLEVRVKPGSAVKKGDVVVLLEAMKMELPLRAPADATVKTVRCKQGDLVTADAALVELQ